MVHWFFLFFFFFKQKTAYEMRISDWSSDVCSSDLASERGACNSAPSTTGFAGGPPPRAGEDLSAIDCGQPLGFVLGNQRADQLVHLAFEDFGQAVERQVDAVIGDAALREIVGRSEEHTSELQSLMRISYAVFCLTKK